MSDHWPSVGRGRGAKRTPQNDGKGVWSRQPAGNDKTAVVGAFLRDEVTRTSTAKFDEACEKIRQSSQKFLRSSDCNEATDSSDDELESGGGSNDDVEKRTKILTSTLSRYAEMSDKSDLGRTQLFLLESSKSRSSVCLICISSIKKADATWSCSGCFCILHLPCIQTWAKDSLQQQLLQSAHGDVRDDEPLRSAQWCCPKCRYEYDRSECPTTYVCFCGKEPDPEFDPWLLPHSCGQTCGCNLKPSCGHKCLLLCHPGPCPPCPKMVAAVCYCGRQSPQTRRCSNRNWSCGKPCGRKLSCDQHVCKDSCHKGECTPCTKRSVQRCFCLKEQCSRPCADTGWQCNTVCDRTLSCGHHKCTEVCHKGPCSDCPRSKTRTCPCGKSTYKLPCTEDVPTCGETCEKMLPCGIHECAQRCHAGVCGMCFQMSPKRCRCGRKKKIMPCHKDFLCDNKCKKVRKCGRHLCNRKCCDGTCQPCEQSCNRSLGCRNHKCSSNCHRGPCYPCPRTVEVKCNCGGTSVSVQCGREKVTKPPKCFKTCSVPADCHHSSRELHYCHFGQCPPCKQVCAKVMKCLHVCPATCHSYVPVKIGKKQVRAGPWEPEIAPRVELVCQPCPPCRVPMSVTCLGQHETRDFPCFEATPKPCGQQCGRRLRCGNHTCLLNCHNVTNARSTDEAGDNCSECEELCTQPRPEGCPHSCDLACHQQTCPPCKRTLQKRCNCQLFVVYIQCSKFTSTAAKKRPELLKCNNQCPKQISCSHRCSLMCHNGPCSPPAECLQTVPVSCPCKRMKQLFACSAVRLKGQTVLSCNNVCKEKLESDRKIKEAEETKRKLDEAKRNEREVKKFQRLMEGKKRKPRKEKEVIVSMSFWKRYKAMLVMCSCVAAIAAVFAYVFFNA